jgi:FK506-binding protein 2
MNMMTLLHARSFCMITLVVGIITLVLDIITISTDVADSSCRSTSGRTALLPTISAFTFEHRYSDRHDSRYGNHMISKILMVECLSLHLQLPSGIHRWDQSSRRLKHRHYGTKNGRDKASNGSYQYSVMSQNFIGNHDETNSQSISNRRAFLRTVSTVVVTTTVSSLVDVQNSNAEIVDATDIFADNDWSSTTANKKSTQQGQSQGIGTLSNNVFVPTDEIKIQINRKTLQETYNNRLGVELVDIEFRTNLRVRVKSVQEGSYAASSELHIQPDWIVVSVDGRSVERTNAAGVRQYLIEAIQKPTAEDIVVVFRDPTKFQSQLRDMSVVTKGGDTVPTVTTQIGPSGDTTPRNKDGAVQSGRSVTTANTDQRITVQQLQKKSSVCTHGAEIDDLLEISYTGTVVETGQIFDGSAILINNQGIPGRGNDISLFFVLGKQPLGQFPPGWDVGLIGMCTGERRRLVIPPALAYGNKGLARRNIPPNAMLQYDITLISINGLAI